MIKLIIIFLSALLLVVSPAYARKKSNSVPLSAGVQEVQAATLDEGSTKSKKKAVKKTTKKTKKSKKSKKSG